jgi:hypothetical protein
MSGNYPTKTWHHLPKTVTGLTFNLTGLLYQSQQMVILEEVIP